MQTFFLQSTVCLHMELVAYCFTVAPVIFALCAGVTLGDLLELVCFYVQFVYRCTGVQVYKTRTLALLAIMRPERIETNRNVTNISHASTRPRQFNIIA